MCAGLSGECECVCVSVLVKSVLVFAMDRDYFCFSEAVLVSAPAVRDVWMHLTLRGSLCPVVAAAPLQMKMTD